MIASRTLRADRAAVRSLAEAVDAARLALGRSLLPGPGSNGDLDARVGRVLGRLWSQRFSGLLEVGSPHYRRLLRELGVQAGGGLEPLESLLDQPCDPPLAERLARAHEITITRRLVREGSRLALGPSGTRRKQGVYYTPPDVVAFIVGETLGALLRPWEDELAGASRPRCRQLLETAKGVAVLDPACGGGAFLLGALDVFRRFYLRLAGRFDGLGARVPAELRTPGRLALTHNIYGVDLDGAALALAELALLAEVRDEGPAPPAPLVGRALVEGDHLQASAFHRAAFPAVFDRQDPGFDAIVGNPPYATLSPTQAAAARESGFRSLTGRRDGDIYPLFVEGLVTLGSSRARGGLIVPLSLVFSRSTRGLREEVILPSCREWRLASFDRIPSGLFEAEVRTRTTIALVGPRRDATHVRTGRLLRFTARSRDRVFSDVRLFDASRLHHPELGFPKLASKLQGDWLERLLARGERLGDGVERRAAHRLHYKQNCYAFAIVTTELPPAFDGGGQPVPQTKYSSLGFPSRTDRDVALALLAGRWLFWWWLTYGDGFDMTGQLIGAFPADPRAFSGKTRKALASLGRRIQTRMQKHVAYKKNGGKRIGTFDLRRCRELTDQADALVARELGAEALLEDVRRFLDETHGAG